MKLIKILLLAFLSSPLLSLAQSIEKGAIVGELGAGIAILRTTAYDKTLKVTNTDTAGAAIYSLFVDYSLLDRVSVAGGLRLDRYIKARNDSNPQTAHAIDIVVRPEFHLVKSNHVNLYAGVLAGVSFFKYKTNQIGDAQATGAGSLFGFTLTSRFFFTKSIGLFINYTYNAFHYANMELSSSVSNAYYIDYKLKGSSFGIGLNVRFQ